MPEQPCFEASKAASTRAGTTSSPAPGSGPPPAARTKPSPVNLAMTAMSATAPACPPPAPEPPSHACAGTPWPSSPPTGGDDGTTTTVDASHDVSASTGCYVDENSNTLTSESSGRGGTPKLPAKPANPPVAAPRRPPQPVMFRLTDDRGGPEAWPAYPRGTDGRADHHTAMHYIRAGALQTLRDTELAA